jgi:cytochrome P450
MTRKTETIAHLDASIKRWKTRLKRSVTMIEKLEKKRNRLAAKATVARVLDPLIEALKPEVVGSRPRQSVVVDVAAPEKVQVVAGHLLDTDHVDPLGEKPAYDAAWKAALPIDTGIPDFLRRGQAAQKAVDEVIADQIREEQAAAKTAKARGRIATLKAKKSGETKKMPLTGKAALAAIRGE